MPQVELAGIRFAYPGGSDVFPEPGLTLQMSGGPVALIGQNGAGKTTLTKLLNGLLRPGAGWVAIDGTTVAKRSVAEMARLVGYAFQNPDDQLFERTVAAEVGFGPRAMGWPPSKVAGSVDLALAACGLAELAQSHPHDLGLSERKWVAIASAIVASPPIVVLDEPTLGQDQAARNRLVDLIHDLAAEGRLVITVSHDMDFVAETCPLTVMLARGQVLYRGPTNDAFTDEGLWQAAGIEPPHVVRLARMIGADSTLVSQGQFLTWWKSRVAPNAQAGGSATPPGGEG